MGVGTPGMVITEGSGGRWRWVGGACVGGRGGCWTGGVVFGGTSVLGGSVVVSEGLGGGVVVVVDGVVVVVDGAVVVAGERVGPRSSFISATMP
ncbi:hypothetical protein [Mycobacterium szulgai]|uniref:hypothetical protein n=1 Tax=Mycobacterium szulgai TaxID=1787 RepID=UPI001B8037D2